MKAVEGAEACFKTGFTRIRGCGERYVLSERMMMPYQLGICSPCSRK